MSKNSAARKPKVFRFAALVAKQSPAHAVVMIRATAGQLLAIASIERLGRDEAGQAQGFQRPQVAGHIAEIRSYLETEEAVLPNALVLAFVDGVKVVRSTQGGPELVVSVADNKPLPGFIVDGQQRLTALVRSGREDFEVFASCVLCRSMEELRRQFILINNTRPLPKSLVYELLPGVDDLPERLGSRSIAAALTELLNFDESSALRGMIKMQTNPSGTLKDTALQRAILNSESAGALQTLLHERRPNLRAAFELVSNFYAAVQQVFQTDWVGHKPTTSRLVHGAGIVAMGYVMDEIYARAGRSDVDSFVAGLLPLKGKTAWAAGTWSFADGQVVPWNRVENTPRQYQQLAEHLVGLLRSAAKRRTKVKS